MSCLNAYPWNFPNMNSPSYLSPFGHLMEPLYTQRDTHVRHWSCDRKHNWKNIVGWKVPMMYLPYFFDQTPQLLFNLQLVSCGYYLRVATTQGSVCFFGKPGDINDSWIRYVQVKQWRLLDAVSSTRSFSVLLLAMGMTCTTQTALALA